jgi:2-keto-3-deoxy-L-rhamnonate aldolase RhmA
MTTDEELKKYDQLNFTQSLLAEDRFRRAARDGQILFNAWLTLNSPVLIDIIGEAGWDSILIDQQARAGWP